MPDSVAEKVLQIVRKELSLAQMKLDVDVDVDADVWQWSSYRTLAHAAKAKANMLSKGICSEPSVAAHNKGCRVCVFLCVDVYSDSVGAITQMKCQNVTLSAVVRGHAVEWRRKQAGGGGNVARAERN